MKLSEAMRVGAAHRPSTRGEYFYTEMSGQICSCALGAAYEGLTGQPVTDATVVDHALHRAFPLNTSVVHPVSESREPLKHVITSLNDDYRWTREQIADWLASIGY